MVTTVLVNIYVSVGVSVCVCEAVAPAARLGEKCFWVVYLLSGSEVSERVGGGGACLLLFVLHFYM